MASCHLHDHVAGGLVRRPVLPVDVVLVWRLMVERRAGNIDGSLSEPSYMVHENNILVN